MNRTITHPCILRGIYHSVICLGVVASRWSLVASSFLKIPSLQQSGHVREEDCVRDDVWDDLIKEFHTEINPRSNPWTESIRSKDQSMGGSRSINAPLRLTSLMSALAALRVWRKRSDADALPATEPQPQPQLVKRPSFLLDPVLVSRSDSEASVASVISEASDTSVISEASMASLP